MKRKQQLIAGVVAGVALAVAAATFAQPSGGAGQGPGMMGGGHGYGAHAGGDPSARVESHLTDLKTQLKITPAQEPAWQAYSAQVKQQASSMQALHAQAKDAAATTAPERMAQHATAMQQQAAGMAATTNAFGALYAVLSPEQRAIADKSVALMGHHGKHHGYHQG